MKKVFYSLFIFFLSFGFVFAQFPSLTVPQGGTGKSEFGSGAVIIGDSQLRLSSTYDLSVLTITATSTSATSTLPNLSITQLLISGDFIRDFAGTGLSVVNGILNAHVPITLTGQDYLSLSTQEITANAINEDNININAPTNNFILVASSSALGGWEWVATTSPNLGLVQNSALHDAVTLAGSLDYLTISGQVITRNTVDISDDTNLTGDSEIVLTDDALSIASSIARDSELHSAVTLSGTPNYITLSGQDIIRAKLDISDDTNATGGVGIDITTNDFTFDATELDALTWSDGSNSTNQWTFDVSGTDYFRSTLTFTAPFQLFKIGTFATDDFISITIQDDLSSGLSQFRFIGFGFERDF